MTLSEALAALGRYVEENPDQVNNASPEEIEALRVLVETLGETLAVASMLEAGRERARRTREALSAIEDDLAEAVSDLEATVSRVSDEVQRLKLYKDARQPERPTAGRPA